MAKCPKCGKHLRLTDWKPECPSCKVNLNYYKANEILLDETEKAEIEHSRFQPKVDRAKASFFGSWMTIVRIVLTFLPLGAVFLPLVQINERKINALEIYNLTMAADKKVVDIGQILGFVLKGDRLSLALLFTAAAAVVMFLVEVICLFMALGKHSKGRNITIGVIQTALAAGGIVCAATAGGMSLAAQGEVSTKILFGGFIFLGVVLLRLIWEIVIIRVGIDVKYKECLIGGLPDYKYFEYVNSGMTQSQIRRKMLVALTELQLASEKEREAAESAEKAKAEG